MTFNLMCSILSYMTNEPCNYLTVIHIPSVYPTYRQLKMSQGVKELLDFNDTKPIYVQIAERIEDDILQGNLPEGAQVPSTNQFATFYQINPATAAKGINLLVDEGVLFKKRGIGMFVAEGAQQHIKKKRKKSFYQEFVVKMLEEGRKINISTEEIIELIKSGGEEAR